MNIVLNHINDSTSILINKAIRAKLFPKYSKMHNVNVQVFTSAGTPGVQPVVFFIISIFYIRHVQNAASPFKPTHFQIDEFIKQLMTSEKFNELADNVAERAALKFKSVELRNITLRHNLDSRKPVNKKHKIIEKQQYARVEPRLKENTDEEINIYPMLEEEISNEERKPDHKTKKNNMSNNNDDYNPRLKKIMETNTATFGKIDTKTFLKNDESSQELYLNYKQITKERNINKDKISKETLKHDPHSRGDILSHRKEDNNDDDDNNFGTHSKEQSKNKSQEDIHKDTKTRINKKYIKADRASSQHSDEKGLQNTNSKTNKKKKLRPDSFEEIKPHARSKEAVSNLKKPQMFSSQINDNTNSGSLDIENNHETAMNADSKGNSEENPNNTSKEIIEVGISRAHSDVELSVHRSEEQPQEDESQNNRKIKKPTEPKMPEGLYRREKGKIYAYVSSSDYDQYHENLARLQNSNVYINTF